MRRAIWRATALGVVAAYAVSAQQVSAGQLVVDTVHAKSLEKNLLGDSPDRSMLVYLPQSYATSPNRRYPVVYLLHGYGGDERGWTGYAPIKPAMDTLVRTGVVREMIIVMPNGNNALGGSFYTNSTTTGNWDDFIAKDLVAFVDGKYRTIARPESRGLAGHSMGGYGTFAVGMRHAGDVYGALYALSGCCTQVNPSPGNGTTWDAVAGLHSVADARRMAFIPRVSAALAAAFSPNPSSPPLFADLPFTRVGEKWELSPPVYRVWVEHAPYDMIASHASQLKRLRGFAFDVGLSDQLVSPAALARMDTALTNAGVRHTYETYDGDHTNRIAARLAVRLLPFFSQTLDFGAGSPR
jgi:S-formylglutathione hydrolase